MLATKYRLQGELKDFGTSTFNLVKMIKLFL